LPTREKPRLQDGEKYRDGAQSLMFSAMMPHLQISGGICGCRTEASSDMLPPSIFGYPVWHRSSADAAPGQRWGVTFYTGA